MSQKTPPGPTLVTRRLRLEPLGAGDLETVHAHWSDPEVGRWLFDARAPERAEVEKELEMSHALFESLGLGIWGVSVREQRWIGTCGFLPVAEIEEIELLFSIDPRHWRRGFALEASRAALVRAFREARLERVVGRCDVPNVASARLLERLGMTLDKREPIRGIDCYHYSIERAVYLGTEPPLDP